MTPEQLAALLGLIADQHAHIGHLRGIIQRQQAAIEQLEAERVQARSDLFVPEPGDRPPAP